MVRGSPVSRLCFILRLTTRTTGQTVPNLIFHRIGHAAGEISKSETCSAHTTRFLAPPCIRVENRSSILIINDSETVENRDTNWIHERDSRLLRDFYMNIAVPVVALLLRKGGKFRVGWNWTWKSLNSRIFVCVAAFILPNSRRVHLEPSPLSFLISAMEFA